MTDRALDFAKFMAEESDHLKGDALFQAIGAKFGDLSQEQFQRGSAIGEELILAKVAEYQAEADALYAELARRNAQTAA